MKPIISFIAIFLVTNSNFIKAQNTWSQKADFGGGIKAYAVGMAIGDKGYIGTGIDGSVAKKDFWQYDPVSNVWSQKADFAGGDRTDAACFSIIDKGYIVLGSGKTDLWEYDPSANTWTKKADFPGAARDYATGISIGDKGYVGFGTGSDFNDKKDWWQYDPSSNMWAKKKNLPAAVRSGAVGFSIDNMGYVGTGHQLSYPINSNEIWQYDPSTDIWTKKASLPVGEGTAFAVGFSINGKGYIGTGLDSDNVHLTNAFWEYDPIVNTWTKKADFPGHPRYLAVGFAIGTKGYIGTGLDSLNCGVDCFASNDFWEYSTVCDSITVYADTDGDTYGNTSISTVICDSILPTGYVYNNTDCNDTNATVNPGATEVCGNSIDDNCNGQVDENCCNIPIGLATTNIAATSAQLNWSTVASATKYKVNYKRDSIGAAWTTVSVTAPNTSTVITNLFAGKKYKWKVKSVCGSEKSGFSAVVKFTTLLRLGDTNAEQSPITFYPNPLITSATISFSLEENSHVNMELYDLAGQKIIKLLDETLEEGNHLVALNRKQLSAGIHLLQIKINEETSFQKIIIQ